MAGIEHLDRHILLINFPARVAAVRSFDDIARLKQETGGLVVAPHPYYPIPERPLGRNLDRHAGLFDAVEVNAMYARVLNRRTVGRGHAPAASRSWATRTSTFWSRWDRHLVVDSSPTLTRSAPPSGGPGRSADTAGPDAARCCQLSRACARVGEGADAAPASAVDTGPPTRLRVSPRRVEGRLPTVD